MDNSGTRKRRGQMHSLRVTLSDVAKQAGVAPITVSRALNTPEKVSVPLRERIEKAVEALGYVPNLVAGGLASSGMRVIPVIFPSFSTLSIIDVIDGIQQTIGESGYQLLLASSDYNLDREATLIDTLLGYSPSGLIISGLKHHERAIKRLRSWGRPIVEVMELGDVFLDMNVGASNFEIGRCMAQHLIERGYKKVAYVGTNFERDYLSYQRYQGHCSALREAGLDSRMLFLSNETVSYAAGKRGFITALESNPRIDAMHFANDTLASGAVLEANRLGYHVPEDIAIAGYLGLPLGEQLTPRLTTIVLPRFEMGVQAARSLLARLEGTKSIPPQVDSGFRLDVREST